MLPWERANGRDLLKRHQACHEISVNADGLRLVNKRPRTTSACTHCALSKQKCDGNKPTCARCAAKGRECLWTPPVERMSATPTMENERTETDPTDLPVPPMEIIPLSPMVAQMQREVSIDPSLSTMPEAFHFSPPAVDHFLSFTQDFDFGFGSWEAFAGRRDGTSPEK